MESIQQTCPWCQESFEAAHFNQRYCCRLHAQKASNARLRTRQNFKTCECGVTFKVTRGSRTYCSDICAKTFSSQHKTETFIKWASRTNEHYKQNGRKAHLKKKYGITEEQFEIILKSQGGVCIVCGKPPKGERPLYVDHDHLTNKIRGLCCRSCNCAIGLFQDNPENLARAYWYIVRSRGGDD